VQQALQVQLVQLDQPALQAPLGLRVLLALQVLQAQQDKLELLD